MPCTTCQQKAQGRCDCCYLVDKDESFKHVSFCDECDAWICDKCWDKTGKRFKAYLIKKAQEIKKLIIG